MKHALALAALMMMVVVAGCGSAEMDDAHFALKVVIDPATSAPSSVCVGERTSLGATTDIRADHLKVETTATNENGQTVYTVRLYRRGASLGEWRYDEEQMRAGHTVTARVEDPAETYDIRIVGSTGSFGQCTP